MRRTELLQEIRIMRFEEVFSRWTEKRLTQEEAAGILGVCSRSFRRYIERYEGYGQEGLRDKRLSQASHRRAPVDEVMALVSRYEQRYQGWSVKHFHSWYRREGGKRSYGWVKNMLQAKGAVVKAPRRGAHRKRRPRAPLEGMMLHQDGSTHEWVPGKCWELIITMDDANSRHYSMFFVEQEGTSSSFRGVRDVIVKKGLFCSLYVDRGTHYWFTPKAGAKVSTTQPTQFGRAMGQLGIELIAAYSPQARGRSERAFGTHQQRLPRELALHKITTMEAANRYLADVYMPAFNSEFTQPTIEKGSAFVKWAGANLDYILCEQYERTVRADNCVVFEGLELQIPPNRYRCHYVRAKVRVHRYSDGSLAIFHGPRKLAAYDALGNYKHKEKKAVTA